MSQVTVRQLAVQVGIPVDRLLLLLGESGLPHTDPAESINDTDRTRLLSYLQRLQGKGAGIAAKVTDRKVPRRKIDDEANVGGPREGAIIEVRKRRTLRAPTHEPAMQDADAESPPVFEAQPNVTTTPELEAAKRALHEEAKRRNADVDASIRADIEAREKAELLRPKPKTPAKPKPRKSPSPDLVTDLSVEAVSENSSREPLGGHSTSSPSGIEDARHEHPAESSNSIGAGVLRARIETDSVPDAENPSAHLRGERSPRLDRPVSDSAPASKQLQGNARRADADTVAPEQHDGVTRTVDDEPSEPVDGEVREEVLPERDTSIRPRKIPPRVNSAVASRPGFHWWSRPAKASAALRPGILTGSYPEREDLRDSWLERTAASAAGLLRQKFGGGQPRFEYFVGQVEAFAEDLDGLDDASLAGLVPELRRRLYSEGFTDELVSRSFAMIREMASRRLGMRHYDVQLYGGWVMLNGMIAEMETGEGKTLTATLTAATVALAGIPVHLVTVNDFLVQRDAAWMLPLYRALGLTVGTIIEDMEPDQRRKAYSCDITYCTNKQLVFDYLKDRLVLGSDSRRLNLQLETLHSDTPRTQRLLLRGLCFAIVDEADSVLVDEARTPLVISKAGDTAQMEKTYRDAIRVARQLRGGRDFEVHTRDRRVDLTEPGKKRAALLTRELKGLWTGVRRRESLMRQALAAIHMFQVEKHYLINDGKVQIVDEYTGRVMADRSWEGGLHQMIQAKEGVEISGQQETMARISYQRFFRRYLRVAGMTGTAHEVARELWSVYRLNVVSVPTNRPAKRSRIADSLYVDDAHKWQAVVHDIRELHGCRQPILVGTRSVGASEHISELLHAAGLQHVVLNARQDQHEAEVVAMAGQAGRITVATNMAGRGTDIRLAPGVADNGGLHVLATERHESGRIDRQLFGRGARQGDPGSYRCIMSLDDELLSDYWSPKILRAMHAMSSDGQLPHWLGAVLVSLAQRAAENNHGRMRRDLLRLDDNLGDMLAFSGRGE